MSSVDCVCVLTARGIDDILSSGGSQAWRINASYAAKFKYLVCIQNSNIDWGTQQAKHHHAFLVGKISGISRAPSASSRWIINIDSYAEIDIADQWDGNRNPVSYRSLSSMGIDVDQLEFKPVSTHGTSALDEQVSINANAEEHEAEETIKPLTLKDAKEGLALYFGVGEDDIQIVIKG